MYVIAYMMCYKKKKGERKERERRKQNPTTNLAFKQVLTLQSYVARNATAGHCTAWRKPRESIAWQSGGGRVKFAG